MTLQMRDAEIFAEGFEIGFELCHNLVKYMRTHYNEEPEEIAKKFQCKVPDVERARACLDYCKQMS